MGRAKYSRAALTAPRGYPGGTFGNKNNHFFALPPEIRSMIYTYFFSCEDPRPPLRAQWSAMSSWQSERQPWLDGSATLILKMTLLRTSKAVLAEALPVLYRYHIFEVWIPEIIDTTPLFIRRFYRGDIVNKIPSLRMHHIATLAPVGQLITRAELAVCGEVMNGRWHPSFYQRLKEFLLYFPNLQYLRLNIRSWPEDRYNIFTTRKPQILLTHLWERLDHLEITLDHMWDRGLAFRETIAPSASWTCVSGIKCVGKFMRSTWSLQRDQASRKEAQEARRVSLKIWELEKRIFEGADVIPRDALDQSTSTRNNHFFALPARLREIVYTNYFSYEDLPKARTSGLSLSNLSARQTIGTHEIESTHESRRTLESSSILALNFPLLCANKAILAEALPFLYRCHIFRVHIPHWEPIKHWETNGWTYDTESFSPANRSAWPKLQFLETLAPAGRFITKLELIELASVRKNALDKRSIPSLRRLLHYFPNLQYLRLNIRVLDQDPDGRHRVNAILTEVWEHLECLEICVLHLGDEGIWFRELIAPASCWVQEMSAIPWKGEDLKKSVWSVRRSSIFANYHVDWRTEWLRSYNKGTKD